MTYPLGALVPLSITITDAAGTPADATAVTLTVTLPDGITDVRTVTSSPTGTYEVDLATTQAGRHAYRWVATGTNAGAFDGVFVVEPADDGSFISLADAKRFIRMPVTSTDDDDELLGVIAAACAMISDRVGPVAPVTVTEYPYVHPCATRVILGRDPVVSVTSFTVDGTDVDPSAYRLESDTGIVTRVGSWPTGDATVTYRAGRTVIPPNYLLAARELTGHLWRTSQLNASGGRPQLSALDETMVPGTTYALPNRVRELLGLGNLPTHNFLVG